MVFRSGLALSIENACLPHRRFSICRWKSRSIAMEERYVGTAGPTDSNGRRRCFKDNGETINVRWWYASQDKIGYFRVTLIKRRRTSGASVVHSNSLIYPMLSSRSYVQFTDFPTDPTRAESNKFPFPHTHTNVSRISRFLLKTMHTFVAFVYDKTLERNRCDEMPKILQFCAWLLN